MHNISLEQTVNHKVHARHGSASIEVGLCALQVCRAAAQLGEV
jgi:hypothetical protein